MTRIIRGMSMQKRRVWRERERETGTCYCCHRRMIILARKAGTHRTQKARRLKRARAITFISLPATLLLSLLLTKGLSIRRLFAQRGPISFSSTINNLISQDYSLNLPHFKRWNKFDEIRFLIGIGRFLNETVARIICNRLKISPPSESRKRLIIIWCFIVL